MKKVIGAFLVIVACALTTVSGNVVVNVHVNGHNGHGETLKVYKYAQSPIQVGKKREIFEEDRGQKVVDKLRREYERTKEELQKLKKKLKHDDTKKAYLVIRVMEWLKKEFQLAIDGIQLAGEGAQLTVGAICYFAEKFNNTNKLVHSFIMRIQKKG